MVLDLSATEVRVLASLLEKQLTTPDVYPLTLNSLRLACNQSTNRDPVVSYDDPTITQAIHRLERRGFARLASGAGSRAAKYRHRLAEQLPMVREEQAVMCVLMLRGQQTPGELKQRTERMHSFAELAEVEVTLEVLIERGLVQRFERRPGQKEDRYGELLSDQDPEVRLEHAAEDLEAKAPASPQPGAEVLRSGRGEERLDPVPAALPALERRIERLELELAELRDAFTVSSRSA